MMSTAYGVSNVLIQGRCVLIIYNEQHLVTTYKLTTATVTSYTKTQLFPVLIPLQIPGSLVDILKNNDCLITIKTMLCKYNAQCVIIKNQDKIKVALSGLFSGF